MTLTSHAKLVRGISTALLLGVLATGSLAQTVVAPNANTSIEGSTGILGPFQGGGITFQWEFPASQFASIAVGDEITSVGFRLDGGQATQPAAPLAFAEWNLQLSTPVQPFPNLSATFANNIGGDVVLVKGGPLIVPANAFPGGSTPNSFFDVFFDIPYTYTGGDLLVTLRHTGSGSVSPLDDANGVSDGMGNTVLQNSFTATTGTVGFFNYPITQFGFRSAAAVPEPGSLSILGIGVASALALVLRKRSKRE